MRGEIRGGFRRAAALQVLVTDNDMARIVREFLHDQIGVALGKADADRDVDPVNREIDELVAHHHVEKHARMLGEKSREMRREA